MTNNNKKNSYLSFSLGKEVFGLNISNVLKILEMKPITKVPESPDYMRGIMNLEGKVLPIVNARKKFGFDDIKDTKQTCILVLKLFIENIESDIGLVVDRVIELIEINFEKIKAPPSIGGKYKSKFINGLYKKNDDCFIMLLDINKLMSSDDIFTIDSQEETIV